MSPSLTLIRSSLPRRSSVFCAVRRASTCGRPELPGVRRDVDALAAGDQATATRAGHRAGQAGRVDRHQRDVRHGLVAAEVDLPVRRRVAGHADVVEVRSASSAASIAGSCRRGTAGRNGRDRRRRLAVERERERAARRARDRERLDLVRQLVVERPNSPELPPPAGVSSPVTIHRLFCESKSMSPAT